MALDGYAHAMSILATGEGGVDLQERAKTGLTFQQQDWLAQVFLQILEPRPEPVREPDNSSQVEVFSYGGDKGTAAGQSFAAAFWLVDHAGVFLRAIKEVNPDSSILRPEDIASVIVTALHDEIGLPRDQKTLLLAHLLIDLGCAMGKVSKAWESPTREQLNVFLNQAAHSLSGTGFELYVLPWALGIELMHNPPTLKRRTEMLRSVLNSTEHGHSLGPLIVRGQSISELELNNWAYFLLLIGRCNAATPMAILATEMARHPRNLDTLGWAYFHEGDVDRALELLDESLAGHKRDEAETIGESWAAVAYHKLYVLLQSGRQDEAQDLLNIMEQLTPGAYWTGQARNLASLLKREPTGPRASRQALARKFEYDIALSFAGEDRQYAEQVAIELRKRGLKVFYDDFERADLWGKNLFTYLTDLYQNRAMYCVVFVSPNYAAKRWTKLEREAAQARAFLSEPEYILPIRLGDTEIPGLLPTVGYVDWQKEGLECIIKYILQKVKVGRE